MSEDVHIVCVYHREMPGGVAPSCHPSGGRVWGSPHG